MVSLRAADLPRRKQGTHYAAMINHKLPLRHLPRSLLSECINTPEGGGESTQQMNREVKREGQADNPQTPRGV